ncbi:ceramide phosphoethanolamine synthase-like isoform X2 [Gigantopelta aegis]|uniref:ceramide phosphoethanolamine synthase-like isoform X2 n=1 Tax=Gigantopelta aegis TaxID=1735272 RepID=UPI001B88D829|nr:ceramide phosphoethanolamine synthase-like isoform X2 [Gigantopelta aegis]
MFPSPLQALRDERNILLLFGLVILVYYVMMDIILWRTILDTSLAHQKPSKDGLFSPFSPLSMKLLMSDPTSHYIIAPTTEYFDKITNFSTVFYFITPNMISFTHLFLAFVSGKFVASENLHTRRIGVVLYQFRTWLDGLDGVVFRSRSSKKMYHSIRKTTGYYVDTLSDVAGGFCLMFGVLFYLFKYFDAKYSHETLPHWTKNGEATKPMLTNGHSLMPKPSRKYLFWKCWCFGFMLGASSVIWDSVVDNLKNIFEVPLEDPSLTIIQTDALHSGSTFVVCWLWRLLEGQSLLQVILIVIWVDKVWEFLNFIQYIGNIVIMTLWLISFVYIHHLRSILHM